MSYIRYIKKTFKPKLESFYDDIKRSRDSSYFDINGMQVYCGRQGSGKTLSAVKQCTDIKKDFPLAILVSNLDLFDYNQISYETEEELIKELKNPEFNPAKDYIFFQDMDQLSIALTKINNDTLGVVYLIDEIHTYFNALDSKNIPPYVFTEISQQRKQRKVIIGTSQLFLRMAKPFREQCDNMINCHTIFKFITIQFAYDGMSVGEDNKGRLRLDGNLKRIGWFFHTREIRNAFDTFQKVVSGAVQYDTQINQLNISKKDLKKIKK